MTWDNRLRGTEPLVLMLIDVRWARFYRAAQRKVFVELPAEACTDKSKVGRLLRSTYGCWGHWSELGIRDLPSHDCNWLCAR